MTAKAYLKKFNLDATFWGERIIDAEENGFFPLLHTEECARWFSHPDGHLEDHVTIDIGSGELHDEEMAGYCSEFCDAVEGFNFMGAAEALLKVTKRSQALASA